MFYLSTKTIIIFAKKNKKINEKNTFINNFDIWIYYKHICRRCLVYGTNFGTDGDVDSTAEAQYAGHALNYYFDRWFDFIN